MFDKNKASNDLKLLPWDFDFDQKIFLKLAIKATWKLEKLNGFMYLIPNKNILISPLIIKESVESSAIENINTTTEKVLQSQALWINSKKWWPEKEVLYYHDAILNWFEKVKKQWWIWFNLIIEIQSIIEKNKSWIRKIPWTIIWNNLWEVIYNPPQWEENIIRLLNNLEKFINNFDDDIDALVKMPVIHYQFESIHPFYDWNGRTWRIINILYLVLAKKLDFPILFLSEYINENKGKYYKLLNKTHLNSDYSDLIVYFLEWVIYQADKTAKKILKIRDLMEKTREEISKLGLDYQKITELLFSFPYLTVSNFVEYLGVSEVTAYRNIKLLEESKIIFSKKVWRNKLIFINDFIKLLS